MPTPAESAQTQDMRTRARHLASALQPFELTIEEAAGAVPRAGAGDRRHLRRLRVVRAQRAARLRRGGPLAGRAGHRRGGIGDAHQLVAGGAVAASERPRPRHAGAAGALRSPVCAGRGSRLLRHHRAERGIGCLRAADGRDARWRRLAHQRREMVRHRRRSGLRPGGGDGGNGPGPAPTIFFIDRDAPGMSWGREPKFANYALYGHPELTLDQVRVTPGDVLGEIGGDAGAPLAEWQPSMRVSSPRWRSARPP